MARRQVTKTAIPSDSSNPPPEPSTEALTASKADLDGNRAQVELKPAPLKVKQQVGLESAASTGKTSDQRSILVGAKEEQKMSTQLSTEDSCLMETLGKLGETLFLATAEPMDTPTAADPVETCTATPQPVNISDLQTKETKKDAEPAIKAVDSIGGEVSEVLKAATAKDTGNLQATSKDTSLPKEPSSASDISGSATSSSLVPKGTDSLPALGSPHKGGNAAPMKGSSAPPATKLSFSCSCGRSFDTRRGLSIHLAHEPKHYNCTEKKDSTVTPTKEEDSRDTQDSSESAPTSPAPPRDSSPLPIPTTNSTPSSPTLYMSAFKTSSRNPQYYSIIRTRRGSNVNDTSSSSGTGAVSPEIGTKRPRTGTGGVAGSPAKAMLLSSGEKVSTQDEEENSSLGESSGSKKKSKDTDTKSCDNTSSGHSPRDFSPTNLLSRVGVMQEFNLRSSPITRSNAASMKTHEFISLPSRRKRGGKRGGWRGGWRGGGKGGDSKHNVSSEDNASEVGEDFEPMDVKIEDDKGDGMEDAKSSSVLSDDTPTQPPRRKRGRPPKVRKDTPSTSPASGATVTKSKSSPVQSSPIPSRSISSSTRSSKSHGRGGKTPGGVQVKREVTEESPLPSKSDTASKKAADSHDNSEDHTMSPTQSKSASKSAEDTDPPSPPPAAPSVTPPPPPVTSKPSSQSSEKHVAGTRTRSKRGAAVVEENEEPSTGKKKASSKSTGSKTPIKDSQVPSVSGQESSASDPASSKSKERSEPESKFSPTGTTTSTKELRSKSKAKKASTNKSRKPSKSDKGEQKKSVSDTEEVEGAELAKSTVDEEDKEAEDPVPPKSQTAQRQSSVIVSVLSASEKPEAGNSKKSTEKQPVSGEAFKKEEEAPEKDPKQQQQQQQQKDQPPPPRRHSETSPVFPYPSTSAPTPTYPPFSPVPYGTFPPQPHMMYPGAPLSAPGTPIYPPHFYSYPGSPPLQMPPPPGAYFPHMVPNTTVDQGLVSPQSLHPPQPAFNNGQQPFTASSSAAPATTPTGSGATPPSVTSVATTVGGVRVSVLDKPPTQLPMVSLPYHMPSATAPRPPRPPGAGYAIEIPPGAGMRAYMEGGAHSPDGLEPRAHIHPPHPLSQVYRPGMMGPYAAPHMPPPHPSYHPPLAVRVDPNGMPLPYMGWPGHEPRPPPSEEHPVQPVECPECGRMFKNNKALNGHMRLHGGFDWTKKQPFTGTDQNKQQSNGSSNSASASSPSSKDTKGNQSQDDSKGKGPSSSSSKGVKRPRSTSGSRSRSNSPAPQSTANAKTGRASKRRKSSDDSNLLKSESRSKEKEPTANPAPLPPQQAPSIFTFDSSSIQPHHSKSLCPPVAAITNASSTTTSTPSSEVQDNGTSTLTHSGSTLDDLCRAAAELERMDTNVGASKKDSADDMDDLGRKRPGNISIPQTQSPSPAIERERHRLGATPPYTPPPILSPSRSLIHLALGVGQVNTSAPCTPNRILQHWNSSYARKMSETEEGGFSEPRINVGEEFQAKLPQYSECRSNALKEEDKATLVWKPLDNLSEEDESMIDGYLELACSPAILHGGRNKELSIHFLHALGGSIKEAVRWLLSGKTPFDSNSGMAEYNYSGSSCWSGRERQQFRRAWKVHRKQFNMLKNTVESKRFSDLIEYYYTWKKYCSDEYRGRNRHISEEIFSDEDDLTYPQVPSSSSSGSGDSERSNSYHNDLDSSTKSFKPPKSGGKKADRPPTSSTIPSSSSAPSQPSSGRPHPQHIFPQPQNRMFNNNLPIVYAPHSSPAVFSSQNINHFPCKYPGCTQIFTSIFALNGHIRVHGGSFFPKAQTPNGAPGQDGSHSLGSSHSHVGLPSNVSSVPSASSRLQQSTSAHSGLHYSHKPHPPPSHHLHTAKSFAELELAKALLELPGSQSTTSTKSLGYHTPSPKPSPGKGKGLSSTKKKLSSSSPGEHEGYYPCNRCGRVFGKVKSRSAHMKSHVIKT